MKTCPRCKIAKAHADFYYNRAQRNFVSSYCKECIRVEMRNNYKYLKEKAKAKKKILLEYLWRRDRGFCGICGETIKKQDIWEIDHIKPKKWGGKNNKENLQITHRDCNMSKGTQYDDEKQPTMQFQFVLA